MRLERGSKRFSSICIYNKGRYLLLSRWKPGKHPGISNLSLTLPTPLRDGHYLTSLSYPRSFLSILVEYNSSGMLKRVLLLLSTCLLLSSSSPSQDDLRSNQTRCGAKTPTHKQHEDSLDSLGLPSHLISRIEQRRKIDSIGCSCICTECHSSQQPVGENIFNKVHNFLENISL